MNHCIDRRIYGCLAVPDPAKRKDFIELAKSVKRSDAVAGIVAGVLPWKRVASSMGLCSMFVGNASAQAELIRSFGDALAPNVHCSTKGRNHCFRLERHAPSCLAVISPRTQIADIFVANVARDLTRNIGDFSAMILLKRKMLKKKDR